MNAAEHPPAVPDFDLLRPIGRGGFGEVWLAANTTTGVRRAVKVIPLGHAGRPDAAGREIVSLTRLEKNLQRLHPNLLAIHHVGRTAGHLFYVMDLADDDSGVAASGPGEAEYRPATLQGRLEGGPLPPETRLSWTRQLLAGLASLHEAGMVHRDVKPGNCVFVRGELKLADFGLLAAASPQVSRLGTERYMPPDGRMDARADVYAAGLVIYEMVTGLPAERFPHLGERAAAVVGDPTLARLVRTALRACQPAPDKRFADARAMLDDLEGDGEPAARRRSFARGIAVFIVMGALIAAAIAAARWWNDVPARVHVNFVTRPFEARIVLDGVEQRQLDGTPYLTPCTIEDLAARPHRVVFRREGSPDLPAGTIDFSTDRQIEASWK